MEGCTAESARCEFWTQGERYLRPACCTQHLKDLLFFTQALLDRHGILHWLDYGSLLGAVRNGEFIPWDGDVDFGILRDDVPRLRALEDEIARAGFRLNIQPLTARIEFSQVNLLHVDLFPWWEENGLLKMRWFQASDDNWAFPREFLGRLQPVELYGERFPAPSPVEEFLERYRYGADFRVPLRPEILTLRARLAPSLRLFVARRTFQERLARNVALLEETLNATAMRGRYRPVARAAETQPAPDADIADAGFAYSAEDHGHLAEALGALKAAGFSRASGSWDVAGAEPLRLTKDGACFEFVAIVSARNRA